MGLYVSHSGLEETTSVCVSAGPLQQWQLDHLFAARDGGRVRAEQHV